MSIVSVDNIQPIGSGTTVTVNKSVTLESGNTNITGVCTATSFSGSGASLTNLPAGNLTGTVADARISTLTASKLTGALPAISGANLTGISIPGGATNLDLLDSSGTGNGRIRIGASQDLQIYHDGSHSWFKNTEGRLILQTDGDQIQLRGNSIVAFNGAASTEYLRINSTGQVTIGGEVHIGSKLVHDGDTDTHINFSSDTIVVTAGNATKMNINNTMVEINNVVQRQGGRQYQTNSNSAWTTILSFSNASANGFSFECAVAENNYTTMYKVGGSPNWNSCYFTSDDAGDSNHAHSSDIEFRVLNDSGTKRLQFKAVSYTTTRYLTAINVWVKTGYVNWS